MTTDYGNTGANGAALIGDTTYGVARPNYVSNTGVEAVTSNMEFFTISTAVDIRMASQTGGSIQSQMNLNKLLEVVSLRGQPIIMGAVTGTGPFAITLVSEHAGAWENVGTNELKNRLIADGVNYGFGVSANGVNDTGLTVTFNNPQVLS